MSYTDSRAIAKAQLLPRRDVLGLVAATAIVAPAGLRAQGADLTGKYEFIDPAQPVGSTDKVEVLEVFSFACPHCFRFLPHMMQYESSAPDYVTVKRMPAIFRDSWAPLAQAFYTSQVLGVEHDLRAPIFDAVHNKKERLVSQEAIREVFVRNDVDGAKFDKAFNSFTVKTRMNEGYKKQQLLGIRSTPTVVIHGRYRVSTSQAGTFEEVITVIQGLSKQLESELTSA